MQSELAGLAETLVARRPDRFAVLRPHVEEHLRSHGCGLTPLSPLQARELQVLVRATHSSYVLELAAELGEATLHLAGAFGQTGRIDAIEPGEHHAAFIDEMSRLVALEAAVRVHRAPVSRVIAALSGPYDLIVLHRVEPADLAEDLVRLLRTGGSLVVLPPPGQATLAAVPGDAGLLGRLASDPRLVASFDRGLARVLATRLR